MKHKKKSRLAAAEFLAVLIAFLQAATATVLSFSLNKSKAENTTGGITYDTATKRDC